MCIKICTQTRVSYLVHFFFDLCMCSFCCDILLSAVEYALKKSRWNFVLGRYHVPCVDSKRVCATGVIRKTVSVFCRDPRQLGKEKSLIWVFSRRKAWKRKLLGTSIHSFYKHIRKGSQVGKVGKISWKIYKNSGSRCLSLFLVTEAVKIRSFTVTINFLGWLERVPSMKINFKCISLKLIYYRCGWTSCFICLIGFL